MKTCTKCKASKELEAFTKKNNLKSGRGSICKDCHNFKNAEWRHKNPGKAEAMATKWNIARAPYRAYKKAYCEKCGFTAAHSCQLHVDHINGIHADNNPSNLQTLCANCHALKTKLHKNAGRKPKYFTRVA